LGLPPSGDVTSDFSDSDLRKASVNDFTGELGAKFGPITVPSHFVFGDKDDPLERKSDLSSFIQAGGCVPACDGDTSTELHRSFEGALTLEQWDAFSRSSTVVRDLGEGTTVETLKKKLASMQTSVRIVRIKGAPLRRNDALGIHDPAGRYVNITCMCSYSKLQMAPLPEEGTIQFTDEYYSSTALTLQWLSLNNTEGPGKGCLKSIFKNAF